jgi:hypothetical protein
LKDDCGVRTGTELKFGRPAAAEENVEEEEADEEEEEKDDNVHSYKVTSL